MRERGFGVWLDAESGPSRKGASRCSRGTLECEAEGKRLLGLRVSDEGESFQCALRFRACQFTSGRRCCLITVARERTMD